MGPRIVAGEGSAGVLVDLFVQLLEQSLEPVALQENGIIRPLQGEIAYALCDDIDDAPLTSSAVEQIVQLDLSAIGLDDLTWYENSATLHLFLWGHLKAFAGVAIKVCCVCGDALPGESLNKP